MIIQYDRFDGSYSSKRFICILSEGSVMILS